MSAFGTKKPGGDRAIQLTFPEVFAATAAVDRMPFAYYPDPATRPPRLEEANDLQGFYHAQKRADAHRMAMAAVKSRHDSDYRAEHSHAGYFGMPKPVLAQRQYANPSNGNQADIYSARPAAALSGGVLFTAESQRWGRQQLRNRIEQLNAIDVAKQGLSMGSQFNTSSFPVRVEAPEGALPEAVSTKAKIELVATLQSISASIDNGQVGSFAYNDVVKFLRLLFRWAASADDEELKEVLEYIDYIEQSLLGIFAQLQDGLDADAAIVRQTQYAQEIYAVMTKVREYVRRMIGVANKSPAERRAASANFIKALGFTKLSTAKKSAEQMRQDMKDVERRAAYDDAEDTGLPEEAFDYKDDEVFSPYMSRYVIGSEKQMEKSIPSTTGVVRRRRRLISGLAAQAREAAESGRSAAFDPSVRDRMGAANGAYEGEELPATASNVRNPFRSGDGTDAALPELMVDEMPRRRPPPRLAATEEEEEEEEEEDEDEESSAPTSSAAVVASPSGFRRPRWLSRDTLPRNEREIRALTVRLRNEGYGDYTPRADTGYSTIRKRIITLWGL